MVLLRELVKVTGSGYDSEPVTFTNSLSNTMVLFSTMPHESSGRHEDVGSYYITEMDRIFRNSDLKSETLNMMLNEVFIWEMGSLNV